MRILCFLLVFAGVVSAADSIQAGVYAGMWKGASGDGTYRLTLDHAADGGWKCEIGLTVGGEEVKATSCTAKVNAAKLETVFDFEVQGLALQSKSSGDWNGSGFTGAYQTVAGEMPVDQGTWSVAAGK